VYPFERKEKLREKLRTTGQIMIAEDAPKFGVSIATLHRDLKELESEGLIKKVTGGAIYLETVEFETHFDIRMKTNLGLKEEIAKKAVKTVQDDTSIFLDHSSTVAIFAKELSKRSYRNLLILTNSLAIPNILTDTAGIQIMLTGGFIQRDFQAISGPSIIDAMKEINIHQAFISCGAISVKDGLMTANHFILEIVKNVLEYCPQNDIKINVLVDSTKFHKRGTFKCSLLNKSFIIYSDGKLESEIIKDIENSGCQIIV
jgi:DeoR/GlpR family transcriptional regulator of sugar metabolism